MTVISQDTDVVLTFEHHVFKLMNSSDVMESRSNYVYEDMIRPWLVVACYLNGGEDVEVMGRFATKDEALRCLNSIIFHCAILDLYRIGDEYPEIKEK